MDEAFKIFVDQLRDGHSEEISEVLSPDFINVMEPDLAFRDNVKIIGKAYLADASLVLHLDIETIAQVPCSICNEMVAVKEMIRNFYHVVPVEEIKSRVYNFKEILRETILLDAPEFAECNEGNCPQRKTIGKYLKEAPTKKDGDVDTDGHQPFADLKLDE